MTEQNKSYVEKHYNWVNLTGLTPGKTYEVVVVAMNPAGEKKRSESRRFDFGPQQGKTIDNLERLIIWLGMFLKNCKSGFRF